MEFHFWDDRPNERFVIVRSTYNRAVIAAANNKSFSTTTVNGITVATAKLDRTDVELTSNVKLPGGCATKDMKERFGYVNDNDTRWGNYKKGVVIAAYNTVLTPKPAEKHNL
jgi:hypothetical protein